KELADGECVRIMTGATIPTGADAIVIQENVTANTEAETITINKAAAVGDNIRLQGADIKLGHTVIATGER
ncbi:MAG TPA: molybdopterin molybdenumtransferase MoeA, partial [Idiomarina sp.]|nr:molybdopterin molybdenumtransferase MoeA [Idiomarina sp.]